MVGERVGSGNEVFFHAVSLLWTKIALPKELLTWESISRLPK